MLLLPTTTILISSIVLHTIIKLHFSQNNKRGRVKSMFGCSYILLFFTRFFVVSYFIIRVMYPQNTIITVLFFLSKTNRKRRHVFVISVLFVLFILFFKLGLQFFYVLKHRVALKLRLKTCFQRPYFPNWSRNTALTCRCQDSPKITVTFHTQYEKDKWKTKTTKTKMKQGKSNKKAILSGHYFGFHFLNLYDSIQTKNIIIIETKIMFKFCLDYLYIYIKW